MPEPAKARPSVPPVSGATLGRHRVPAEDMDDTIELEEYSQKINAGQTRYAPLYTALSLLQGAIHKSFRKCDRDAIRYQKSYQWVAIFAVGFGALTILCAILEFVVSPDVHAILTWGEPVAGGLTLLLIGFGSIGKFKEKWLTARYKAENLRLLKFRKLTDARLWCPPIDMALLAEELQDDVRKLEAQNYEDAKAWSSQGLHPSVCGPPCMDTCDEALHELIEYYRPKRLHVQMPISIANPSADEESGINGRQQSCRQYFSRALHLSWHTSPCTKATEGQPSNAGSLLS